MGKIRILVVDDAVVVRRMLTEVLNGDPGLEVVGTAANGVIALAKLPQVNPDLVIMDVEMPEMDGLQTLKALRKTYRRLPVIMFSTLTQRGATSTLDALALGANDYVTKPANVGSVAAGMQRIREQLIPKVKALCGRAAAPATAPAPAARPAPARMLPPTGRVELVVIGVSTGGPNALATVLPTLPADLPVPVLIVQHMPPIFTRLLSERLAAQSAVRVAEGAEGVKVAPGAVWLAPGDYHMEAARDGTAVRLRLQQGPPENSCRPAADVLFRSAAAVYGPGVLAVVLTGMGQDGLRGAEAVREAGGHVIAQDEATSVVWGMPGFVARAGLADRVLPLTEVGPEIVARVRRGRVPAAATV
ncbi:MAG TPA: chemotaxis response regulator protein-glutamate methylesterase [Gemmataceae bacterium]|nr:chemotaxis response regulator protein-glutamate methylesterase [Gemmataceae bacterium]